MSEPVQVLEDALDGIDVVLPTLAEDIICVYELEGDLVERARFFLDQDRARAAFEGD